GVLNMPLLMDHYPGETFSYQVTVVTPNVPLYLNTWFDWNSDGDWEDVLDWCGNPAPEWAVQNQSLVFDTPGVYTVRSSPFRPWQPREPNESFTGDLWMRITLSEQPWTGSGVAGSGPANGYQFGETEDYYFKPAFTAYCLGLAHPLFCEWYKVGTPACWCNPRQCHGDADFSYGGSPKTGFYYVGPNDIGMLVSAWLVLEPPFGPGIASSPYGICADFAHDLGGNPKTGFYRVGPTDLNILIKNWLVLEPDRGPGIPPDCLDVP
ncbi:MAG: GEVED domain-containing protein, partial [Planctomycetota bacterium]